MDCLLTPQHLLWSVGEDKEQEDSTGNGLQITGPSGKTVMVHFATQDISVTEVRSKENYIKSKS